MTTPWKWIGAMSLALAAPCFAQQQPSQYDPQQTLDQQSLNQQQPQQPQLQPPQANSPQLQPSTQAAQPPASSGPTYLDQQKQRKPASPETAPPAQPAQRSETQSSTPPNGTQLAFFELSPTLGSIAIHGRSTFSVGSNFSFRLAENTPFYFEPSLYVSLLSGDNNSASASLFHVDAGLRYDFIISGSPLVPFLKAALGPTISDSSNTTVNGNKIGSYFNIFAGGGLKVLINPHIGARLDTGVTLQDTDSGLYAMGSVVLPL